MPCNVRLLILTGSMAALSESTRLPSVAQVEVVEDSVVDAEVEADTVREVSFSSIIVHKGLTHSQEAEVDMVEAVVAMVIVKEAVDMVRSFLCSANDLGILTHYRRRPRRLWWRRKLLWRRRCALILISLVQAYTDQQIKVIPVVEADTSRVVSHNTVQ